MDFVTAIFPHGQTVALFGFLTFLGSFAAIAALELMRPARRGGKARDGRLAVNFGLGVCNLAISALLPISSLAMATLAGEQEWGLFQFWPITWYAAVPILLLAQSFTGYWVHRAFHTLSFLWPLHAVHHRDDAIDLSTSFRSHPLNHVLVLLPNALLILALGPDIWTVLVTEALLLLAVLFQHANMSIPDPANDIVERWLVTPRMHLVHHARERHFHDSNYGESLAIWDRLFGTYQRPPAGAMELGVKPAARRNWPLGWLRMKS